MMNVLSLYDALNARFPENTRVSYDFDGLQVSPGPAREVKCVLLALDLTRESVARAKEVSADVIVTHHPIFFSGVRTLECGSSHDADNATELIRSGIAHISMHTRFDAGCGGINDTLSSRLALSDITPFSLPEDPIPLGRQGTTLPCSSAEFAARTAKALGTHVLVTGDVPSVSRVCVVGGGGSDYVSPFLKSGADVFVTGEVSHHHRIAISEKGKCLIEAGHWGSEVPFCEAMKAVLEEILPSASIQLFRDTAHEICVLP